nr:MAG TPA: hypothetical protein [Caudoviricetes sp.]
MFWEVLRSFKNYKWSRWESNPRPNTCQHICLQP